MQALGATVTAEEALLEFAGCDAAAGVALTACLDPLLGKAHDESTKQTQGEGGFGITHPTMIFGQSEVQGVVQAAFDSPIAALELEQARRIQFLQGETADQINDFSGFLALASNSSPEPGRGLNSGKAHLRWAGLPTVQHPDLASPAIVLPRHRMGLGCGTRGKNAVA